AELSGRAEHGARHRGHVHAREPRDRPPLRRDRPARAAAMTRGGVALRGLALVAGLTLVAVVAPALPIGSPTEIAKDHALRGPTLTQPFGMDDLGRSVLSRVVHAYRISLGVAVGSVALALLIG